MKEYKNIVSPVFRGSFANLVTPRAANEEAKPKYSIAAPFPKKPKKKDKAKINKFLNAIESRAEEMAKDKWGKVPPSFKRGSEKAGIRDGDLSEVEQFQGCWVVQPSSLYKPGIIDTEKDDIIDPEELYSGAHYRITVSIYVWSHEKGGKGYSVGLQNVMKVKDDEQFGGGIAAADDFDELEDEPEDD